MEGLDEWKPFRWLALPALENCQKAMVEWRNGKDYALVDGNCGSAGAGGGSRSIVSHEEVARRLACGDPKWQSF